MQVLVWSLWNGHVLLQKKWARSHRTSRLSNRGFPCCGLQCRRLLSFALLASEQTQNAEDVVDMMLFKCKQEVEMLSTVTRLFYSVSVSSNGTCLESQSSRVQWVQRFCFRGRSDVNIGQVGDSRRTVRSLSAASKPRITQRTTRYTPSIQVEGARQIFRVREFRFLLWKICVAHSVTHSFTFLLCCAFSDKSPARRPEAV